MPSERRMTGYQSNRIALSAVVAEGRCMSEKFDAIVIGAGQAGPSLAVRLANEGAKTAIIERNLLGGTCVNVGCTPTKTLVASARAAHIARRAKDFGIAIGGARFGGHEAGQGPQRCGRRRLQSKPYELTRIHGKAHALSSSLGSRHIRSRADVHAYRPATNTKQRRR